MAAEWSRRSLGDLAELHKRQVNPAESPKQLFQHFSLPAFDAGQAPVVELGARIESQKFLVPPNAILVSKLNPRIPRVWEPCVAKDRLAVASTEFLVLVPKGGTNRRFLKYACLSPMIRSELQARVTGTSGSHQRVRPEDALTIEVDTPKDESEQRAIAHILGTLDDKIELNRRMNEALETMARALFRSWFVDFDPVRAKAEGRDPGLPQTLADLFPASFEDSELGEVPMGWAVEGLDQVARFLNGLALQKYPPVDGRSLPVIKIAQLRAGDTSKADLASADLDPDYIVENGDILFSWSGSLECVLWAAGPGALNQHLFKVTSSRYPKWLCYLGVHHHLEEFRHIAAGKATTMGHIQRHHLSDAKLAIPSPALLGAMNSIFAPLVESTWRREVNSRTLAALRDTLLPKLVSGELRVGGLERFVAEVQ